MLDFEPWEVRAHYAFIVHVDRAELLGILCGSPPTGQVKCYGKWLSDVHDYGRCAIVRGDGLCGDYHASHDMCEEYEVRYAKELAVRPRGVSEWQQIQRHWAMRFIGACYKEYIKTMRNEK